jgi:hypothetical protein
MFIHRDQIPSTLGHLSIRDILALHAVSRTVRAEILPYVGSIEYEQRYAPNMTIVGLSIPKLNKYRIDYVQVRGERRTYNTYRLLETHGGRAAVYKISGDIPMFIYAIDDIVQHIILQLEYIKDIICYTMQPEALLNVICTYRSYLKDCLPGRTREGFILSADDAKYVAILRRYTVSEAYLERTLASAPVLMYMTDLSNDL